MSGALIHSRRKEDVSATHGTSFVCGILSRPFRPSVRRPDSVLTSSCRCTNGLEVANNDMRRRPRILGLAADSCVVGIVSFHAE